MSGAEQMEQIDAYMRNKKSASEECQHFLENPYDFLELISHDVGFEFIKTLEGKEIYKYATVLSDILIKHGGSDGIEVAAGELSAEIGRNRSPSPVLRRRVPRNRQPVSPSWLANVNPIIEATPFQDEFSRRFQTITSSAPEISGTSVAQERNVCITSTPLMSAPRPVADLSAAEFIDGINAFRTRLSPILAISHSAQQVVQFEAISEEAEPQSSMQPQPDPQIQELSDIAVPLVKRTRQMNVDEAFRDIPGPSTRRPEIIAAIPQTQSTSDIDSGLLRNRNQFSVDEYVEVIQNFGLETDRTVQQAELNPLTSRRELALPEDTERQIRNEYQNELKSMVLNVDFPDIPPDDEALLDMKRLFQEQREQRKTNRRRRTPLVNWSTLSEPEVIYPIVQNVGKIAPKITNNEKIYSYPDTEFLLIDDFKTQFNLLTDIPLNVRYRLPSTEIERQINQLSHVSTQLNVNQPSQSQTPSVPILENFISMEPELPLEQNNFRGESHEVVPEFVGPLIEENASLDNPILPPRNPNRPYRYRPNRSRRRRQPVRLPDIVDDVDLVVPAPVQEIHSPVVQENRIEETSGAGQSNENIDGEIDGGGASSFTRHYMEWKEVIMDKGFNEKQSHTAYLGDLKKSDGEQTEAVLNIITTRSHTPINEVLPPQMNRIDAARRIAALLEFQTRNIISLERDTSCNVIAINTPPQERTCEEVMRSIHGDE